MRVVLELSDVLEILSARFGSKLSEQQVVIRNSPFEIEVKADSLPLAGMYPATATPKHASGVRFNGSEAATTYGTSVPSAAPEPEAQGDSLSLDEMLRYSRELEAANNSRRR